MKNLLIEQQEAVYEQYVEEQREELRNEGAEELRMDILRELKNQSLRAFDKNVKLGIEAAIVVVERANR
jgi:coproporphyrinogen III oxidase-like Fe-S oxidoreductase